MKAIDRRIVLHLGRPASDELRVELKVRGLECETVSEVDLAVRLPAARAVVVRFDGDEALFLGQTRRSIPDSLWHGVLPVLISEQESVRGNFTRLSTSAAGKNAARSKVFYEPVAAAQAIAEHDPGPGATMNLVVSAPDGDLIDGTDKLLLQRAFHDFVDLKLSQIPAADAGTSGARVWIALPPADATSTRSLPYIVKIGEREKLRLERDQFETYIADHVPFVNRPNIAVARWAEGESDAILVQDFVLRSHGLREVLKVGPTQTLVTSLLEDALSACRMAGSRRTTGLVDGLRTYGLFERTSELATIDQLARKSFASPLDLASIDNALNTMKDTPYRASRVHGDLHPGNVFTSVSSSQMIMIDFGKAGFGPSVVDPACLEVGLAWRGTDIIQCEKPLADDALRTLFAPRLEIPSSTSAPRDWEWLWDAIAAIRIWGWSREESHVPYELAVAGYLQRFAKYPDAGSPRRRALALFLASSMIDAVTAAAG